MQGGSNLETQDTPATTGALSPMLVLQIDHPDHFADGTRKRIGLGRRNSSRQHIAPYQSQNFDHGQTGC
jgi:hypothetical protein